MNLDKSKLLKDVKSALEKDMSNSEMTAMLAELDEGSIKMTEDFERYGSSNYSKNCESSPVVHADITEEYLKDLTDRLDKRLTEENQLEG